MDPLLLHWDRFLVRALQQRCFIRGKTVISLFIGGEAIFTSLFMKEDKNCMLGFFCLLAFGVKNEPHHSWNYPGEAGQFKRKKALCATVEMAFFPIKQASAVHERFYPYKESPLCRGSSGMGGKCQASPVCLARCPGVSLFAGILQFLLHSHLPQEYLVWLRKILESSDGWK